MARLSVSPEMHSSAKEFAAKFLKKELACEIVL
jgi:hypothetical protein